MRGVALCLLLGAILTGCAPEATNLEAPLVATAPVPDVNVTELGPRALPGPAGPGGLEMPPGTVAATTEAIAARLPLRIGPWVRAVGPPDDGLIARNGLPALYVRYTIPGNGVWATVAVNDHGMVLPDGLASPAIAAGYEASKAVVRANAPGDVARMRMVWIPDAPAQRCVSGRVVAQDQGTEHFACATGVAGQELRLRITAGYRPGDAGRLYALEGEIARLIAEVTRAAAGRAPAMAVRADGRIFIPRLGPEATL